MAMNKIKTGRADWNCSNGQCAQGKIRKKTSSILKTPNCPICKKRMRLERDDERGLIFTCWNCFVSLVEKPEAAKERLKIKDVKKCESK